jgi:hypothetical protein
VSSVRDSFVQVLLDVPIGERFDYRATPEQAADLAPGDWVVVPWAQTRKVGLVVAATTTDLAEDRVRGILAVLDDAPPARGLVRISGIRRVVLPPPAGRVALPALPSCCARPGGEGARLGFFNCAGACCTLPGAGDAAPGAPAYAEAAPRASGSPTSAGSVPARPQP